MCDSSFIRGDYISKNGGIGPYKGMFCGDIPLHRPYIGLIYGRYLQFRYLKWPFLWWYSLKFPEHIILYMVGTSKN